MANPELSNEPAQATNSSAWDQVIADFRRICLLKRQGRLEESAVLLNDQLPLSIAAWSRDGHHDALTKRKQLQQMFSLEEQRIENAWFVRDLLFEDLRTSLLAELRVGASSPSDPIPHRENAAISKLDPSSAQKVELSSKTNSESHDTVRPWKPRRIHVSIAVALPKTERVETPPARPRFDQIPEILDWILAQETERTHSVTNSLKEKSLLHLV